METPFGSRVTASLNCSRSFYPLAFTMLQVLERGALLRTLQTLVYAERCCALRSNHTTTGF
jgi:hypothetical protein